MEADLPMSSWGGEKLMKGTAEGQFWENGKRIKWEMMYGGQAEPD